MQRTAGSNVTTQRRHNLGMAAVGLAVAASFTAGCGTAASGPAGITPSSAAAAYGRLPLSFEANRGQVDRRARFVVHAAGSTMFFTPRGTVLSLAAGHSTSVVRLAFAGARPAQLSGTRRLAGTVNYLTGSNRARWHTGVPTYAGVRYSGLWRGIDAVFYGNQRRLEYDLRIAPGADPARVALRYSGARGVSLDRAGRLVLSLPTGGRLIQLAPRAYQLVGGHRHAVVSRYVMRDGLVRLHLGRYDRSRALVVDPVLAYSTFLGGSGNDAGTAIAVDAGGNAYVTGTTASTSFPTAGTPLQAANAGGGDVFVAKLDAAGSALVYSTYLGGSAADTSAAIAVDSSGNAYITGDTTSTNFPTASAAQASNAGGGGDAFVAELNAAGSALIYSTYVGGSTNGPGGSSGDHGQGIAVDSGGNAYVAGWTASTNFPTTAGAFQLTPAGGLEEEVFVVKYTAAGAVAYSTYIGGASNRERGRAIAVDAGGVAFVAGNTTSTNFPTVSPFQVSNAGGGSDAFVAKLNAAGSALTYSTYLGGSSNDIATGIAIDGSGNMYVTGTTSSTDFPTASPLQASSGGATDGFVTKLNAAGSALTWSTYLGGNGTDTPSGIAIDSGGDSYIAGSTASTDFPAKGSPAYGGSQDAFVTKLNAAASALVYSTYLGANGAESAAGIAVDSSGAPYVTGSTASSTFPTTAAAVQGYGGGTDAFVTKLGLSAPTVGPTSFDFGSQSQGVLSAAHAFTISHPGVVGPITITAASVTGTNADDYSVVYNDCVGAQLTSGHSCTLRIRFAPAVTGASSATLAVASTGGGTDPAATLTGTGTTGAGGPAGATGATGATGPTGADGTGAQGPAGPNGVAGPQGPKGDTGPQGPAGTSSKCTVTKVKGKQKITCKQIATRARVVSMRLTRGRTVYASGHGAALHVRRTISRGRYTLTIVEARNGRRVVIRRAVRI